jgi:iron complex transport system ATP-binding protein
VSLAARDLAFGFPSRVVGQGVSLELAAGGAACLLGPNGSGKTTLLRTLLGLLPPRGGEVALEGRPLASWKARERAQRLAYVPQAADSYFEFSALEMVEMGRAAHRGAFAQPGKEDRRIALESLDRLGIAALAPRTVQRLSGGERQLVLLARALATGATYLLLDEPTAHLDFANQARVLEEVRRLAQAGHAVLFTTHVPDHAFIAAGRAFLLRGGTLLAAGAVDEVMTGANLTALYGRPVEVLAATGADGIARKVCLAA